MTPEEFMHTLTDMVYVEHFDADTWRKPCDPVDIGATVSRSLNIIVSYEKHPMHTGRDQGDGPR